MTTESIEKYCHFIIIFTKYWANINTYIAPRNSVGVPMLPLPKKIPALPALIAVNSESTVTVLPSTAVFFHGTYRGAQSVVPPNTNTHTHTSRQTDRRLMTGNILKFS